MSVIHAEFRCLYEEKTELNRLNKLLRTSEKNLIPFRQHAHRLFAVQALLTEIDGTRKEIKRLEDSAGLLFRDKDKVRACNLLKTQLENLFNELKTIAQKKSA